MDLDDAPAAPPNHFQELSAMYAAIGDPVRIQILTMLAEAETGEICACNFVIPLAKSQPTISHHLRILAAVGLVVTTRKGRWIWYSIEKTRMEEAVAFLEALTHQSQMRKSSLATRP